MLHVFVRAMDPDERLQIDHVARAQVAQIAPYGCGKLKQAGVGVPVRLGLILKLEAILAGGNSGNVWFYKDMRLRLRDESKDGHEWPGQHSGLFSGQRRDRVAPAMELRFTAFRAVEKIVKPVGEGARSRGRFHGIAQRHFLERKQEVRSRLDPHGARGDFSKLLAAQERAKRSPFESLLPLLVCVPFVVPFPSQIGLVSKSPWGESEGTFAGSY